MIDQQAGTTRRGVAIMARSLRMHPWPHAFAIGSACAFALSAVGFTIAVGRITDSVIVPALDEGVDDRSKLYHGIVVLLLIAVVRAAGVVGRRYFGAMAEYRTQRSGRRQIADQYLDQPLAFHRARTTGELLAHADSDIEASTVLLKPLPFTVAVFVLIAVSVISLLVVHPALAIVAVVLFPILAGMNKLYTARVEGPATRAQDQIGVISQIAHESFDGVLAVKTLGREDAEIDRMRAAAETLRDDRRLVGRLRGTFEPAIDALPNLGILSLLALGGWLVSRGQVTVGEVVQAMTLFSILAVPVRITGFLLEEMPRSVVARERIDRMLASELAAERQGRSPMPAGPLGLSVRDLSYSYGDQRVLVEVSFDVRPGEAVALVGSTGSGKSTLLGLLAGLEPPAAGEVVIGGVNLSAVPADEVASAVVPVFQETFLFADTIRENIALGRPLADDALRRVATIARADRFVEALPDGYDTTVGERGVTLSGGQRQRIALARALARRPRVLLLDDATSAVDPRVEADILAALRTEADATLVIVAHRLSTIRLADRVVFVVDGQVRRQGSHAELLEDPEYEALIRAYESDPEPERIET